jgi:hypothetical protein
MEKWLTPTPETPPVIIVQPQSQRAALGESIAVSVEVDPDSGPPFTYQWRFEGEDIQGATEANYTISSFQAEHVGSYSVVVSNAFGETTSAAATLTLPVEPVEPHELPGLVLHLDVTTLELEDGAPVSLWPDLSGIGNHAVQADGPRRPIYFESALPAGGPAVRFEGTPLPFLLVQDMGSHDPPNTIFLVWKINQATGGTFQSALDGATASERVQIGYEVGPSRMHALSGGSYPARALFKSISIPFENPIVTSVVYDPAGGLLRVNGFLEDQNATGDLPITGLTIGRRTAGDTADTQSLGGNIAELIVYDRRLTDGEIEQVEQYLMDKWLDL